jgi:hypothetical protein
MSEEIYPGPPGSGIDIWNAHGLNVPKDADFAILFRARGEPQRDLRNWKEAQRIEDQTGWPLFVMESDKLRFPPPEEQQ